MSALETLELPANIEAAARVRAAETILLPKNSNEEGATKWLKDNGFDVPDFPGRSLTQKSEGRTYRRLRDPEILNGVLSGRGDIGFLGSDKLAEWQPSSARVDWVGEVENCDFVLAALAGTVPDVQAKLQRGEPVYAITGNVRWLGQFAVQNGWRLDVRGVSGSAEAFGEEADMIADLRVSGDTLRDNGMEEFQVLERVQLGLLTRMVPSVQILDGSA